MKTLGFQLWLLRHRANISQNTLAFMLGVSAGHISSIECGRYKPSQALAASMRRTLEPIAAARSFR